MPPIAPPSRHNRKKEDKYFDSDGAPWAVPARVFVSLTASSSNLKNNKLLALTENDGQIFNFDHFGCNPSLEEQELL